MSHISTVQTAFTDVNALAKAVAACGYKMTTGGVVRFWNNQTHKVDHSVKLNGPFDIGFKRNGKVLDAEFDPYQDHVAKEIGNAAGPIGKLQQAYSKELVKAWALKTGRSVSSMKTNTKGELVLEVVGGS